MWYNRLSQYLLKERYVKDTAIYVDDLNLIGTPEELIKTANYLKREFEMKDLGKISRSSIV